MVDNVWKITTILLLLAVIVMGMYYYKENKECSIGDVNIKESYLKDIFEIYGDNAFVICDMKSKDKCLAIRRLETNLTDGR